MKFCIIQAQYKVVGLSKFGGAGAPKPPPPPKSPPNHKTATGLKIYISSMLIVFDEKSNGYQYSQDWTAGLTFCIKIIFKTKSKILLPVSLYPAFDQSVLVSTSWLRTTLY